MAFAKQSNPRRAASANGDNARPHGHRVGAERGVGYHVISSDTVPFCLWSAARWLEDHKEVLGTTVSGLGDRDTTYAIVGGIVAAYRGRNGIPDRWRLDREPLPVFEPVE